MLNSIKVSVIIPVFNSEKYLTQCIDSVLKQTLKEFELLCIDDGSTDQSYTILNAYAKQDCRIKVYQQRNKGGGAARNYGLERAVGDYLIFLDSDDFFDHEMLEKVYNRAVTTQSEMCIFGVKIYNHITGQSTDAGYGLRKKYIPQKDIVSWKDMPNLIFNVFQNWPWNKMFRREFVLKNKIKFQEIFRTNDLLFTNTAFVYANRITVLSEALVYYRTHTKDNCQSTNRLYPFDFYTAFMELKTYLVEQNIYETTRISFINHALDGCIANLESLEFCEEHRHLFYKLKESYFSELDIDHLKVEEIHDFLRERYLQYIDICECDYCKYITKRASKYKDDVEKLGTKMYQKEQQIKQKLQLEKEAFDFCEQKLKAELNQTQEELSKYKEVCNQKEALLEQLKNSKSYIIGQLFTYLPRKIVKRFK